MGEKMQLEIPWLQLGKAHRLACMDNPKSLTATYSNKDPHFKSSTSFNSSSIVAILLPLASGH